MGDNTKKGGWSEERSKVLPGLMSAKKREVIEKGGVTSRKAERDSVISKTLYARVQREATFGELSLGSWGGAESVETGRPFYRKKKEFAGQLKQRE